MSNELTITDLCVGDGKECVKGALITTHYTGWLEDVGEHIKANSDLQFEIELLEVLTRDD